MSPYRKPSISGSDTLVCTPRALWASPAYCCLQLECSILFVWWWESSLLFDMSVLTHAHGQVCCCDMGHEVEPISMVFWSLRKKHPQVSTLLPLEIQAWISAYLLKPDSQAHLATGSPMSLRSSGLPLSSSSPHQLSQGVSQALVKRRNTSLASASNKIETHLCFFEKMLPFNPRA